MINTILMVGLLTLVVAVPGVPAQPAPAGTTAPAAPAVDPASIQALKAMGAYLQTLQRFRVVNTLTGERVLADGQKLQHTAWAAIDVQRPNKIHIVMRSPRAERAVIYDGTTVTLYTPAQKYYSSVAFTGPLGALIDQLEARYGVQLPLQDLFRFGTPEAPLDTIESAMNAGQDLVGRDVCDHYAFRQGKLDWQLWLTTGDKPLPRKLVITNRADEAHPQSTSLIDWQVPPTFKDTIFTFTPPKGTTKIELMPVQATERKTP